VWSFSGLKKLLCWWPQTPQALGVGRKGIEGKGRILELHSNQHSLTSFQLSKKSEHLCDAAHLSLTGYLRKHSLSFIRPGESLENAPLNWAPCFSCHFGVLGQIYLILLGSSVTIWRKSSWLSLFSSLTYFSPFPVAIPWRIHIPDA
jgi:hypothetical protein